MLVLITGTDTGIGKTIATAGLLKSLLDTGQDAIALKPIESGHDLRGASESDTFKLLTTFNDHRQDQARPATIDDINLYSYRSPAAPLVVARHEKLPINWNELKNFISSSEREITLVEGSGGIFVPIMEDKTYSDLATELSMKVIVIVGSKLGCINHTLLTIDALQHRKIDILGYIFNELGAVEEKTDPTLTVSRETNRAVLRELLEPLKIMEIDYMPHSEDPRHLPSLKAAAELISSRNGKI